ncbi:AAA family ATPase [Luethyella okanaganae]|uniref:CpaE family protein n=1 Tax=Luethyella okanaganae TaxID=69372 RepID=A0ABW1VHW0_9MICO
MLLVTRSHEYEARLGSLLGESLTTVLGATLIVGADVVLHQVEALSPPDFAFLGPFLSYEDARELSCGLTERYPGVGIILVHESHAVIEEWVSEMPVHAVLSPTADDAAVTELLDRLRSFLGQQRRDGPDSGALDPAHDRGAPGAGVEPIVPGPAIDLAAGAPHPGARLALFEPPRLPEPVEPVAPVETVAPVEGERSHIIAVVSPKGGLGKTTVATNLAVGLARAAPMSVVLVDADMQFGDVATALGLEPAHTLPDMVSGAATVDTMVLKTLLTRHPCGFYAVCGSESPADGDRVSGEQLEQLIRQLAGIFRYVVIDTAPGLGEQTLSALEMASDAILLCSLGVPSLRGLRKELALLASIGLLPPARHIVLNFVDRMSGLSERDAEAVIGVPVDIAIPRSAAVPLSTNRGVPLLQEGSRDPAAKALARLVTHFEHGAVRRERGLQKKVVA